MKYLGSRVLETDRLILRPTKEEDLKIIWTILCDEKVAEHYLVGKFNYDWEKEKVWQYKKLKKANNEDVFQWSIILKSENKCIGQASCQKSHDEFGNENSDNIRDVGWFDNIASWKVIEKLGFHRTGKIKKVKYTILTEEVDCYCYEITREEYLNLGSK